MDFLNDYGLFLAKSVTAIACFSVIVAIASAGKKSNKQKGKIVITNLNDKFNKMKHSILEKISSKKEYQRVR